MLQSFHQSSETFEVIFNKDKYNSLPDKLKSIIANAVEAVLKGWPREFVTSYRFDPPLDPDPDFDTILRAWQSGEQAQ